jgi:ATP-dependent Clp protease ATP-binding subunit ClpA
MSEYREEHSDQKLFGAPPGYIGYEAGGQLTNAIKERPFSILLFDEIEKANKSIMDKFLQILEDGRMTDGQGNTVYFSESIIVFTSNLGIVKEEHGKRIQLVDMDKSIDEITRIVKTEIKNTFKPEVYNRIGDGNVIVFDFIRKEISDAIVKNQIDKVNKSVQKQNKITVDVSDCYQLFCDKARETKVLEMGGRGIGNLVEDEYVNPLARYIFDEICGENSKIKAINNQGELEFGAV